MKKLFQTGNLFYLTAVVFFIVSLLSRKYAVYLSLAVVFFILGLAARKKNAEKTHENKPKM